MNVEAYSHEVSSAGFWPGNDAFRRAAFYSYAYPSPAGFAEARVEPDGAVWSKDMTQNNGWGRFFGCSDAGVVAGINDKYIPHFLELDLRAEKFVGIHWGTFGLAREPYDEPPRRIEQEVARRHFDPESVWILRPGATTAW